MVDGSMQHEDVKVLAQRVGSLESTTNAIMSKLDGIVTQLAERGRTPWGIVVSIIGTGVLVIGAIGGLAFKPLSEGQVDLKAAMMTLATRVEAADKAAHETFVDKGEFATILGAIKDRRDDAQRVAENRFARAEKDIDDLQKAVVPRGEIDERWNSQRAHDADMQRQLDELRSHGEALYGPRDEIQRLSREVDDIRSRSTRAPP